ncbi:uncharacterized protein LOC136073872 [Hydra vulgaris]|uniref:uncharacterized protein LOC136073872 n=1 Tax=Hydra vulgaris TaxID=6087 RepID=UPI0032E9ED75
MAKQVIINMNNGENLLKDVENATLTEMPNNCKFIVYNGNPMDLMDASDNEKVNEDNASVNEHSDSDDEFLECVQSDSDDEIIREIFDKYDQITMKKSNLKEDIKNLELRVSQLEDLVNSDDDNDELDDNKIAFKDLIKIKQDKSDNQIKIEKSNLNEEIKEELRNLDIRVSLLEEPNGLPDGQKIFVIKDIVKRMNINSNDYRSTLFSAPFFYKNHKMTIRISFNMDIDDNNEMIHGDYIGIFVVFNAAHL